MTIQESIKDEGLRALIPGGVRDNAQWIDNYAGERVSMKTTSLRLRVAELEAKMDSGYQDGRRHACALLSQLVYTSDGEPLDQAALLELCINVETDYGL